MLPTSLILCIALISFEPSQCFISPRRKFHLETSRASTSWGVDDDWSSLSEGASRYRLALNEDPVLNAARTIESQLSSEQEEYAVSPEDDWIQSVIDEIQSPVIDPNEPALYDTKKSFDTYSKTIHFEDSMATEIGLLVRCNESPDEILVAEGRALPALTDEEKYNPSHLLVKADGGDHTVGGYDPTEFYSDSVSEIFNKHCDNQKNVLNSEGIASWISQSLGGERVGMFDKRVGAVLSRYSTHGSGALTREQFMRLYMDAAVSDMNIVEKNKSRKLMKKVKMEQPNLKSVWRDLQNHGIESPVLASEC